MNWRILFFAGVLGVFGAIVYGVASKRQPVQAPRAAASAAVVEPEPVAPDPELAAGAALALVRQWVTDNPDDFDEGIRRCEALSAAHRETAAARDAAALADGIRGAKEQAVRDTLEALNAKVRALEERRGYREAIALVEAYAGPFAQETASERTAESERLRGVADEHQQQGESAQLRTALSTLLMEGVQKASAYVSAQSGGASSADGAWRQLADALERAGRLSETVLESFRRQRGEQVLVELKGGRQSLPIAGVEEGAVLYYANVGGVRVTKRIALAQLSENELTRRVGEDMPGLLLFRLASFASRREYAAAKSVLDGIPSPLRESLAEMLEGSAVEGAADAAWNQLRAALFRAGVKIGDIRDDPAALLEALKSAERSPGINRLLHAVARDLALQYRDSEWIKDKGVIRLINAMLALKPEGDGAAEEVAENVGAGDDASGKDAEITDWRKEIDF